MRSTSFLILLSYLMAVMSFNQFIYDSKSLVNYVTKGTMKYMKSYVSLEDLQQQTLLSYYKYKNDIVFPLDINSFLIKWFSRMKKINLIGNIDLFTNLKYYQVNIS